MNESRMLVSFAHSGIAAHWYASAYRSLLELAEARVTSLSGGHAGRVSVTTVRAGWYPERSSTNRTHSTGPPPAISSCAAHSRVLTSSSTCDVWPQVKD